MEYKRFSNTILVRLDRGDEISTEILKIARAENVSLASISGIGATDDACIGVFDMDTKTYSNHTFTGTHEITSLMGNITTKDNVPYSHIHITLAGPDGKIVGGHLLNCIISLTCEIFITVVEGNAERKADQNLGINKIGF